jgi:hypothetical protein
MFRRTLIVGFVAAFWCPFARATDSLWSRGGPEGGNITVLAADPQHPTTVYAGTLDGGIWKTTDGAAHWSLASSGLKRVYGGFTTIDLIVVDPIVSTRVYAAPFIGLYKSDDGGQNWAATGVGVLDGLEVPAVAINPNASSTVFAGTSEGVYVSTDAGVNWKPSNAGLHDSQGQVPKVLSLAIDPLETSSLIAGTSASGTFASADGGATWQKFGGTALDDLDVTEMMLDPSDPTKAYALSPEAGLFHLVYPAGGAQVAARGPITRNSGIWILAAWTLFGAEVCGDSPCEDTAYILFLPRPPLDESFAPFASSRATEILLGTSGRGLYHSLDGGTTFTAINSGLPSLAISAIVGDAGSQTRYAGSGLAGIAKTTDDAHWSAANTGLFASEVYAVAASKSSPSIVYAATGSSIFKSVDAGVSWQNLTSIGVDQQVWPALAVDPTNPSIVYAATDEKGVIKTTNGGASWTVSNAGISTTGIDSFAIVPSLTHTVYAGTDSGIFKSTDAGAHWSLANPDTPMETVRSLAIDPVGVSTIFAGTDRGIFRSMDAGAHWADVSASSAFLPSSTIHGIAVDPAAHTHVYLATSNGVWRSTDGGSNWTEVDADLPSTSGHPNVTAVAVEPGSKIDVASIGVITGDGDGVYRSTDGGASWTALDAGLTHGDVDALAASGGSSPILYAGTVGGGVFRSPAAAPPPPPGKRKIIPVHPAPPKRVKEPRP